MNTIKYVGLDVHKAVTVIAVLNERGQVESQTQIKTKADNFRDFFRGLSGTVHIVLEEGGSLGLAASTAQAFGQLGDGLRSAS